MRIITMKVFLLILVLVQICQSAYPVYASSCDAESPNRACAQQDNVTEYLLSIKKGGTNILATDDYNLNFFLCEQYTFDCGYVEYSNQTVSIANGIQLRMNASEVDTILPANASFATRIKSYLNLSASDAKCGMKIFPLILTPQQSELFFTNYMNILLTEIKNKYLAQKMPGTLDWASINVNIKTAICQVIKQNRNLLYSTFWDDFKFNNFTQMSDYLKEQYRKTNQLYNLRSAYLIDSVTQRCNKLQSVNFLVDQSGSIGAPGFQLALDFLYKYIDGTLDDPKLTSIHFYDSSFQPYLDYGKTKEQLLQGIKTKFYRSGGTLTGIAINQTIKKIMGGNFDSGMNKIMVLMTDGKSFDEVNDASNFARSKGITMIAVGIGSGVNDTQLLEIAQTPSNVIKVTSYADLGKLVSFIENFFCKQIIDLRINQTIVGNVVRVPESPAYFRVQKSSKNETYLLRIRYEVNPDNSNQQLFTSEYDPFPDQFSQFTINQTYRPSILERVYFVNPSSPTQIRTKKNYIQVESSKNGYLSVGGTNMKFNISLTPCKTTDCKTQKESYKAVGSKKDIKPTDGKDYNIYGIIAGSVAALICLSLTAAAAIKQFGGSQEQVPLENTGDNKIEPQLTEQDINDEIRSGQECSQKSEKKSKKSEKNDDDEKDSRKSEEKRQKKTLKNRH